MLKLHCKFAETWDEEPFVLRLTSNATLPMPLRHKRGLIVRKSLDNSRDGFRTYFQFASSKPFLSANGIKVITLPADLQFLRDGDIVRISPSRGELRVIFRRSSDSNSFLLTERCNSNCVMCSQPPREIDDSYIIADVLNTIPLIQRDTRCLGLTGGEPTLLGDDFLRIVRATKNFLPETSLHVLSNGRLFQFLTFSRELGEISHPDIMIGVPLYSDIAHKHDFVVQSEGAFDETIRGILNLGRVGVPVEIRIVVHRYTYDRLPQLAQFISRNLTFVSQVALMGLEMMGYVKMNLDALWIDPVDYQKQLCVTDHSKPTTNDRIKTNQ